jgi:hypothetical protein
VPRGRGCTMNRAGDATFLAQYTKGRQLSAN